MKQSSNGELSDLNPSSRLTGEQRELPKLKGGFALDPEQPAEAAVYRIAHSLLQLACRCEPGILADSDPEFVHQYRVNLRKCRSLINLFKKNFSAQRYRWLKTKLKIVASRTNELRDLDVFLLDKENYREILPKDLQQGLVAIYHRIERRRNTALKQVAVALISDSYQQQIGQLLRTLQEPEFCRKQSQRPIRQLVCKKVLAQYKKVCHAGEGIDAETPDAAIHQLRIECKKLRYLLELFGELFAQKPLKKVVKRLKKLQDNLGRFNDYAVQREFLDSLGQGRKTSPEQLASIHGLTAVLYSRQCQERSLVVETIVGFTQESVREQFQQLFGLLKD